MVASAFPAGRQDDAVAVDYRLEGPRNAAAVARGESRLVGVALSAGGGPPSSTQDDAGGLESLGDRPRVYDDAILGLAVERAFGLPGVDHVDDVRLMRQLLRHAGTDCEPPSFNDPCDTVTAIYAQFASLPAQLLAADLGIAYAQVEIPLIDSIVDMTMHGLPIDTAAMANIESATTAELEILRHQINEVAGLRLDPDDDGQVADFLYGRCGLPVPFWTRRSNEPSVSGDALRLLGDRHPILPCLRRHRDARSVVQSARTMALHLRPGSARLHGRIDTLGAATGRLTCEEANLLGLHHGLRRTVAARDGHVLVEADISQAEFRVLAHFSQEQTLLDAYRNGDIDLHRQTVALAMRKPLHEVTDDERQIGKAVNFGIVFGQTEFGLARALGITEHQAAEFIDGFFRGRPRVATWIESVHDEARRNGYVRTKWGHRRALPEIRSGDRSIAARAQRQAVNTIIQGTAAELMKLAIARVRRALPAGCRLLLSVHDSVLVESPVDLVDEVATVLNGEMTHTPSDFTVPIKVETKAGPTWGGCQSITMG